MQPQDDRSEVLASDGDNRKAVVGALAQDTLGRE